MTRDGKTGLPGTGMPAGPRALGPPGSPGPEPGGREKKPGLKPGIKKISRIFTCVNYKVFDFSLDQNNYNYLFFLVDSYF